MTFKSLALSSAALLWCASITQAANCNISMPASGNNAQVAAVNANIVAVLQAKYPGVDFQAPTANVGSNVTVPNCVAADFAPTGAQVVKSQPAPGGNAGEQIGNAGTLGAFGAGFLALILLIGNSSSSSTGT